MSNSTALVWLRRDLRLHDHAAFYHALKQHQRVIAVFIFDRPILEPLPRDDRRVAFIHASLAALQAELQRHGSDLVVRHDDARSAIPQLAAEFAAAAVYANRDYEPAAIARDDAVATALAAQGIAFHSSKDQVIFEQDEVLTQSGGMYSVFTPYKRAWLAKLNDFYVRPYPVSRYLDRLATLPAQTLPALAELGFADIDPAAQRIPAGIDGAEQLLADFLPRIERYQELRDFPARKGPSYLSVHLRFGTVSIRELAALAWRQGGAGAETWLSELIWREFYLQILWHRPEVAGHAFKPEYDALPFPNDPALFAAWCEGRTGYPLVDAAMRQLNQTGYMHNRLRMVTASFLVKDLLIDWRWGERYFAEKLIDFDLAANNGGWQWAASTGCDAQPYFRIFNPVSQSEKFDADGRFIKRYCPELAMLSGKDIHAPWLAKPLSLQAAGIVLGRDYPAPVVDHAVQRDKALALFKKN
ncbi:deoxyribodipyrimidine photo-lyase type I [Andreprevotia lacus DSM 23236]|jgi:deoxyribodipyrimidine photo-lyase|uniref:Deoxyribodipyrimidine photo-lyase n=1 Tax=Andreprevotia lacus DSM 23236 TaxID=1121001 RepID=A0A1W1X337_9NEIS|nr:deoxyribodipyrimidine photo-lyase [Andreprevotia lacus]SMC18376.1 deoxyribodipyrimidine photo-lyase type I [Andreprevotia lacus DSM 23236]